MSFLRASCHHDICSKDTGTGAAVGYFPIWWFGVYCESQAFFTRKLYQTCSPAAGSGGQCVIFPSKAGRRLGSTFGRARGLRNLLRFPEKGEAVNPQISQYISAVLFDNDPV